MATLKLNFGVVSTDEHIQEAPDTWTGRMSKEKFGDDIPHLGEMDDGTEQWFILGSPRGERIASGGVAVTPKLQVPHRWEDVPESTYVPAERLKAMDQDEVDTHTFFPDIAGFGNAGFQKEGSEEFRLAAIRAYNDWLVEEWTDFSPRYISQCISPMWSAELARAEIERSVKKGHKGIIWHGAPEVLDLPYLNDTHWDPVYEVAADMGAPLALHLGAIPTLPAFPGYSPQTSRAMGGTRSVSSQIQVVANILFSGIFDRFPKLKTITVESAIGWIPYLLETADHNYENFKLWEEGVTTKPSEAFHNNMWANFWFERNGILNRYVIGVDNIIYETDFPHPTSTWPNSKECREKSLEGVPQDEQRKILMENAIKLYQLDVDYSGLKN